MSHPSIKSDVPVIVSQLHSYNGCKGMASSTIITHLYTHYCRKLENVFAFIYRLYGTEYKIFSCFVFYFKTETGIQEFSETKKTLKDILNEIEDAATQEKVNLMIQLFSMSLPIE